VEFVLIDAEACQNPWRTLHCEMMRFTILLTCLTGGLAYVFDEVRIVCVLPLTGLDGQTGQRLKRGIQVAMKEMNRSNVFLYFADDNSNASTSGAVLSAMVAQHQPHVIIGGYGSSTTLKQAPLAKQFEIPYVSPGGASSTIYSNNTWAFGMLSPIGTMATTTMETLRTQMLAKILPTPCRLVLMWEDTDHGNEYRDFVLRYVNLYPGLFVVVHRSSFPFQIFTDPQDFEPYITPFRSLKAEALLVDAHEPDFVLFHQQLMIKPNQYKFVSYGARGMPADILASMIPISDGLVSAQWWADTQTDPTSLRFLNLWHENELEQTFFCSAPLLDPGFIAPVGYQTFRTVVYALDLAKNSSNWSIRQALHDLVIPKNDTLLGDGQIDQFFDPNTSMVTYPYTVLQTILISPGVLGVRPVLGANLQVLPGWCCSCFEQRDISLEKWKLVSALCPQTTYDSLYVVLAIIIAVLGAWTALLLSEYGVHAAQQKDERRFVQFVHFMVAVMLGPCCVWASQCVTMIALDLPNGLVGRFEPQVIAGVGVAWMCCLGSIKSLTFTPKVASRFRKALAAFASGLAFSAANVFSFLIIYRSWSIAPRHALEAGFVVAAAIGLALMCAPILFLYLHLFGRSYRVALVFLLAGPVIGAQWVMVSGLTYHFEPTDQDGYGDGLQLWSENALLLVASLLAAIAAFVFMWFIVQRLSLSRNQLSLLYSNLVKSKDKLSAENDLLHTAYRRSEAMREAHASIISKCVPVPRRYDLDEIVRRYMSSVGYTLVVIPQGDANDLSVNDCIQDPILLILLKQFAHETLTLENVDFAVAAQLYVKSPPFAREALARQIFAEFIAHKSPTQVNLGDPLVDSIGTIIAKGRFPSDLFEPAFFEVCLLIQQNIMPRFKQSPLWNVVKVVCQLNAIRDSTVPDNLASLTAQLDTRLFRPSSKSHKRNKKSSGTPTPQRRLSATFVSSRASPPITRPDTPPFSPLKSSQQIETSPFFQPNV
jgi:branched-chain amino acid transport system substrate-binding protein